MHSLWRNTHFEVPSGRPQPILCLLGGKERVYICPDIVIPKRCSFGSFKKLCQDTRDSVRYLIRAKDRTTTWQCSGRLWDPPLYRHTSGYASMGGGLTRSGRGFGSRSEWGPSTTTPLRNWKSKSARRVSVANDTKTEQTHSMGEFRPSVFPLRFVNLHMKA